MPAPARSFLTTTSQGEVWDVGAHLNQAQKPKSVGSLIDENQSVLIRSSGIDIGVRNAQEQFCLLLKTQSETGMSSKDRCPS